ncbi:MAG: glycosyl transferase family 2 [Acidobacteriaceae bacterium]|nr:glycosyl transferase family 2 [Acidobacteriaceae bacterium]
MAGGVSPGPVQIVAVVVLYHQSPSESVTVATLAAALKQTNLVACRVLVYDNTPSSSPTPDPLSTLIEPLIPEGFRYHRAAENRGLFGAYSAGLALAREEGCEWLLTLDQDTALPPDFFAAVRPGVAAASEDQRIGAIVPHLAEGDRLLSPAYVGVGRSRPLPRDFGGVPAREARAFNSAALLRVEAIEEIGGFHPCFWLDHLDSWLHRELFLHGWRIYVLASLQLEHHFSLLNYRERVSIGHFRNFLMAESAFFDLYGTWWERALYTLQLGVRMITQYARDEPGDIQSATRSALLRRLRSGRTTRLMEWRKKAGGADTILAAKSER